MVLLHNETFAKLLETVFLNGVKNPYALKISYVKILHCIQDDKLLYFAKVSQFKS